MLHSPASASEALLIGPGTLIGNQMSHASHEDVSIFSLSTGPCFCFYLLFDSELLDDRALLLTQVLLFPGPGTVHLKNHIL